MENTDRMTLEENAFRRSDIYTLNSNFPSNLDINSLNNLQRKNYRNMLKIKNSYEHLNPNLNENQNYTNRKWLDIPDKTLHFPSNYNNNYNPRITNEFFHDQLEFAFNRNNNNFYSNRKNNNGYLKSNTSKYLGEAESHVKQKKNYNQKDNE